MNARIQRIDRRDYDKSCPTFTILYIQSNGYVRTVELCDELELIVDDIAHILVEDESVNGREIVESCQQVPLTNTLFMLHRDGGQVNKMASTIANQTITGDVVIVRNNGEKFCNIPKNFADKYVTVKA